MLLQTVFVFSDRHFMMLFVVMTKVAIVVLLMLVNVLTFVMKLFTRWLLCFAFVCVFRRLRCFSLIVFHIITVFIKELYISFIGNFYDIVV